MKHTAKYSGKKDGFSLLEVLIALTILSIGILGVASMQISATKGNTSARGMTEAATIGQQQLELLLSYDYGHPLLLDTDGDGTNQDADEDGADDDGGNFGLEDINAQADFTAVVGGFYNLSWNIAIDEPVDHAKWIRLFVRWQTSGFATKELVFDTIKVSGM